MDVSEIQTPALCVDVPAMDGNIERMAGAFREGPCNLRPHFKAHKTPAIARRQADAGCRGFTLATLGEAEILADEGFADLLIANEICDPAKRPRIEALAERSELIVAVDSTEALEVVRGLELRALVDINVGLPRCGVPPEEAVDVARAATDAGLRVAGVMGYEGHAMIVEERDARAEVARESMAMLTDAVERLTDAGFDVGIVSAGGTGTYDITGEIEGVTEIQAGSYALMDTAYAKLGLPFEEALRCITTVVSVHGNIAVLDAGLKTLAVDHGDPELPDDVPADVLFLSDEHTTLATRDGWSYRPGDRVWLRPSHVDPTVNLHDRLYAIDGEGVVDVWRVAARGYTGV